MNIIKDIWQSLSDVFTEQESSDEEIYDENLYKDSKLKSLSRFNWNELEDAYGKAVNAPKHLLKLASEDKKVREDGLDELSYTVYHQGSIYTSAVAAMAVLHEILQLEKPKEKQETFEMLSLLISGSSWHNSHQHLSIFEKEAKSKKWQNSIEKELTWVEEVQKSANEKVDLYISFLQDNLKENRLWSSDLLTYLKDSSNKLFPQIVKAIGKEKDLEVRANLYIAAECFTTYEDVDFWAKAIDNETDQICKILALRTYILFTHDNPSKQRVEELLKLLFQIDDKTIRKYHELPSAGDFHETFTIPLLVSKEIDSQQLLEWYINEAKENEHISDAFAVGLFNVAFEGVPEQTIKAKNLTDLQREAVMLIAKKAFPKPNYNIGWFNDVLHQFKFPSTYEKLCEYLGEKF